MTIALVQHDAAFLEGGPFSGISADFTSPTAGNTLWMAANAAGTTHIVLPAGWTERFRTEADGSFVVATKVSDGTETGVAITLSTAPTSIRLVIACGEVSGEYAGVGTFFGTFTSNPHPIPSVTPGPGLEAFFIAAEHVSNAYDVSVFPTLYSLVDQVVADTGTSDRLTTWQRHVSTTLSGPYTDDISYVSGTIIERAAQLWFGPINDPPVAEFTASFETLTTYFFDESTGTPTSWSWDFGDGSTSTSQNPVHIYASAATYTVCLTVTNAFGSDSICHTIHVVDIAIPPTEAGGATVEIYVHDPSGARWDEAKWDEAVWSTSGWVDVTPQSIDASIRWGVSDASKGILSIPDAATWDVTFLDPDRLLDPSNQSSPFFGDIVPYLPIRVNHNRWTVKTGVAESIGWYWDPKEALGRGFIRATDNIARMANAKVPEDTTLSDTLVARARDAIAAAGLSDVVVLDVIGDDPDLVPWETGTDQSAWDWIKDAAQQVLYQPYIDRDNQLGFRAYADPMFRDRDVTDADLINLAVVTTFAANYSVVKATEEDGVTVQTRELTPKPAYGARTYERRDPTPNAGDWAQAVLEDRSLTSLRWVPGEAYPLTAERTRELLSVEAVELIGIFDNNTDPVVAVDGIVLGGLIRITARQEDAARWWVTFEVAQTPEEPLIVSGSDPPEFLLRTGGIEYLYRSL